MQKYILTALAMLSLGVCPILCTAQRNPFTVADSIELVRFNDPTGRPLNPPVWNISPDRLTAIIVTTKGIIKSNTVESTLWTLDLRASALYLEDSEMHTSPRPKKLYSVKGQLRAFQDNSYGSLITESRWSSDSKTIYMLIERNGGRRELVRVDTTTQQNEVLSSRNYSVGNYEIDSRGVLYSAGQFQDNPGPSSAIPSEVVDTVRGRSLVDLLWPSVFPNSLLFRSDSNGARSIAPAPWYSVKQSFFISPDGSIVVSLVPVDKTPTTWKQYLPSYLTGPLYWPASSRSPVLEWEVIDLRTHSRRPLLGSPSGRSSGYDDVPQVVWPARGDHALVTNTFLPFDKQSPKEQEARRQLCAVAYVGISDRSATCIALARSSWLKASANSWAVQSVRFGQTDHNVVINLLWLGRHKTECYSSKDGVWSEDSEAACDASVQILDSVNRPPVRLEILQSLDEPPTLWAEDVRTSRRIQIWNPNPQRVVKDSGTTSVYHWFDKDRREWTGGLILPPGYKLGIRYPLVVQTHGFDSKEFLSDGSWTTAMAARPLAAAGFVVLQIEDKHEQSEALEEAKIHVNGYEAAIQQLADSGVVDPKRVGIIGFSRTCWYVEEALLEYPNRFAAAVIADGVDQSYLQYMLVAPENPSLKSASENNARPIGKDLETWIKSAPGFRLEELKTPLRIQAIGPFSLLLEWETYASLRVQDKPVDLLYLPRGQHVLQNPAERLASEEGDVDWFRYWLKGEKDSDPAKRAQYERWDNLRKEKAQ